MAAFRAMCVSFGGSFPSLLQWSFPTAGATIDVESGDLNGGWIDSSPVASVAGLAADTWANGVGTRVKWTTGAVHNGHVVVGSTFLVPLRLAAYEGSGNIGSTYLTQLQGAVTTFAANAQLRIYARKTVDTLGASYAVNAGTVPDRVSWLRGRRT